MLHDNTWARVLFIRSSQNIIYPIKLFTSQQCYIVMAGRRTLVYYVHVLEHSNELMNFLEVSFMCVCVSVCAHQSLILARADRVLFRSSGNGPSTGSYHWSAQPWRACVTVHRRVRQIGFWMRSWIKVCMCSRYWTRIRQESPLSMQRLLDMHVCMCWKEWSHYSVHTMIWQRCKSRQHREWEREWAGAGVGGWQILYNMS